MTKSATAAVIGLSRSTKNTTKTIRSSRKPTPAKSTKPVIEIPNARAPSDPHAGKLPTKQTQLAALLVRDEGATLDQMIAATGWLPHTTRAALTGLKKKGYAISSDKIDGLRTYRAVAPQ